MTGRGVHVIDAMMFLAGPIDQVVTSENLSDAFGLPLVVTRDGARFSARGR